MQVCAQRYMIMYAHMRMHVSIRNDGVKKNRKEDERRQREEREF